MTIYTNAGWARGLACLPGAGRGPRLSDRALKANVAAVDGGDVLARLAQVPVSTWNYTSQDPSIRHMGPMAQDFYAAFGLGEDDRHITTVDADGVALAAIQGLMPGTRAAGGARTRPCAVAAGQPGGAPGGVGGGRWTMKAMTQAEEPP